MKTILSATAVLFFTLSSHVFSGDKLDGEQIKTLFSDKTVDIEKVDVDKKKKKYLSAYTSADGSRILYIPWKNKKSERKWWVEGDQYCGSHPKNGDYCRDIVSAGDGTYHALVNGKHLRTFSNFRDGNQL
jgi:hypothetical protein